jgi:hypothetical protein
LGEAQGGEIVTPLEIFPGQNTSSDQVVNFARFLQGLDIDGDPANGINIAPDTKEKIAIHSISNGVTSINFKNLDKDPLIIQFKDDINLPTKDSALEHLQGTINKVSQGVRDFESPKIISFGISGKDGLSVSLNTNTVKLNFSAESEGDEYYWCLKPVYEISSKISMPSSSDKCWDPDPVDRGKDRFSEEIEINTDQNKNVYFYLWLRDFNKNISYSRIELKYEELIEVQPVRYITNKPFYEFNSNISGDLILKGECPEMQTTNPPIVANENTTIYFSVKGYEDFEFKEFKNCIIQIKGDNQSLSNDLKIPPFKIDVKSPVISNLTIDIITGEDFKLTLSESVKISFSGGCELNTKYAFKGENLFSFENLDSREYNNCTLFAKDDAGNESAHAIPTFKVPQKSDLDAGFGMIKIAPVIQKIYCRIDQNNPSKTNIWARVTDDSPTSSLSFKWTTDLTETLCSWPECWPPTYKLVGYIIDEPESSSTFVQDFSYNDSTTIKLCVTDPSGSETCLEKDIDGEVCL